MYTDETKARKVQSAKDQLTALRAELLLTETKIKELRVVVQPLAHNSAVDMPELMANVSLAFRHCEDARMRLGKAIQALEGGVSIFDKASLLPFPLTPSGSPTAHDGEPAPSPF